MTVSRKKRRLERRRHHQRSQSAVHKARRREFDEKLTASFEAVSNLASRLGDPDVDPHEFADQLSEALVDDLVGALFAFPEQAFDRIMAVSEGVAPERLTSIADELSNRAGSDPRFAWTAAGLASAAQDPSKAQQILEAENVRWETRRAETAASEPDRDNDHVGDQPGLLTIDEDVAEQMELLDPGPLLARLLLERGCVADALGLLDPRCASDPTDDLLQSARAFALHLAFKRAHDSGMREAICACGSARTWSECCRDRERASLERFADRRRFHELRVALIGFQNGRSDLATFRDEYVDEWINGVRTNAGLGEFDRLGGGDEVWELDEGSLEADVPDPEMDRSELPFRYMAVECSWFSSPDAREDTDEQRNTDEESDADDDSTLVIAQFASDPNVPEPTRLAARGWLDHTMFGLWQVLDPAAEPGVWLVDLLTRRKVYATLPEADVARMPRWTVLLGGMFPVDGIWSLGGTYLQVDPTTADRLAHEATEISDFILRALAKERGLKVPSASTDSFTRRGLTPPYGVVASLASGQSSPEASFRSKVLRGAMRTIVGAYERLQRASPSLTNTDGDPLELLSATFALADPGAVLRYLARHPDFEQEDADGGIERESSTLVWFGREMSPAESAQSLAQFRAEAARRGLGPVEETEGPKRWIRGHLNFHEDRVTIEVNSQKRLERITTWLRRAGATGDPVVEHRFDPNLDMALPKGPTVLRPIGSPEAEDTWRHHWLEEEVPALGGATPRDASVSEEGSILLEALLRRFEHDADLARLHGEQGVDVEWLRSQLDMEITESQYEL